MNKYYQVAVDYPGFNSVFTYECETDLARGELVTVPFGRRSANGTILGESTSSEIEAAKKFKIKQIKNVIGNSFSLSEDQLKLYTWMSKYYHYSLGKLIFDCLPKVMKRPKKIEFIQGLGEELSFSLNEKQAEIYQKLQSKMFSGFSQNYLHGVTGSGKSAIYIGLIKDMIEKGRSVQFLLPEINLTPQFTKMFQQLLKCPILTYHSGVTPSEKYTIWKHLHESQEAVLLMGVRSSIFLPMKNLGLIIVDEEHDQSFKQYDRCPYNGRDVAIKKAQLKEVPILLGSATPSMENYYLFSKEKDQRNYFSLRQRAGRGDFPELVLKDVKGKFTEIDSTWPLLEETLLEIKNKLDKKEQVLVFINKLGYSQYVQCRNCGHQFFNENCGCQNNLRYFKKKNCLSCSHCEFVMPLPEQCPECGSIKLLNKGFGTERVQQVLSEVFKDYTVERFDRDEIKNTRELEDKLSRFHNAEIDIFVGTQMLAKGHNFKNVNLVVVLGIDSMLNYSDFRSSEKTYQLVEQISGRAGRYKPGARVIIQTMTPDHDVFKHLVNHSFNEFYEHELPMRELCECPPFSKIIMIFFSSSKREKLINEVNSVASKIRVLMGENFKDVRLLGPAPMGIEKKASQFTWAIMLKSQDVTQLHQCAQTIENNYHPSSQVSYKIDVDPFQML